MNTGLRVLQRFVRERFFDQAAQTAYYLLLSMLPFFIFVISLLNLFPVNEEILFRFLRPFIPEQSFQLIEDNVREVLRNGKGKWLYFSLAGAFWLSSVTVQSLARSLDLANGYIRRKGFWLSLFRDLGVTLLFMLVVPLSILLPFIENILHQVIAYYDRIDDWKGWLFLWPKVKWGLGTLFLFAFFLLFYKFVPSGKVLFRQVVPGAFLSTIGWQLFSYLFGGWVTAVDYTRLYGQLAGIIMLVIWLYMTAVIILVSGLLNAECSKSKRRKWDRC
ncbi:YihY/virulence factor BrkB family protein [Sporosarcina sp. BI001-red]|uniref:YihY/virulence factor BrkB family protein n=1 Tax=Sporosarcina sp. BI001-red TaxID=2282866 RepID=UPI000E254567|nr:YihY/virulence factor BrkB family protein [Sporosarcina sp. BI001-red]REB06124.1 YihY/virulence factor BrkB family protein [Sporosarcina sp. BI001-red]